MRFMGVAVGDIVSLKVTEVTEWACWGVVNDQVGFVHCVEWSWRRPIPGSQEANVGDELFVKVYHLTDCPYDQLPADVTFQGKFNVDFAASVRLLDPEGNPWNEPEVYQVGDTFDAKLEEVNPFGCWVRHPRGADCRLLVDGNALGFEIGQKVSVKVVSVNPQKKSLEVVLCTSE